MSAIRLQREEREREQVPKDGQYATCKAGCSGKYRLSQSTYYTKSKNIRCGGVINVAFLAIKEKMMIEITDMKRSMTMEIM